MVSFGYPKVGNCGEGVFIDHPSPNPCPFQAIETPSGVTVTPVTNTETAGEQPTYGYCLGGLRAVPKTIAGTVGSETLNSDGSINEYITSIGPALEIQQPPSFCPSGSQLVVRWASIDGQGGAFCSSAFSANCDDVVYMLTLS
jgi:hypothetical protein